MQKLVVIYENKNLGYSMFYLTLPVLYESKEQFTKDFNTVILKFVKKAERNELEEFSFAGHKFNPCYLGKKIEGQWHFRTPDVYTLEEWFEKFK